MRARILGTNDLEPARQQALTRIPIGRMGTVTDIAKGIVFLASDVGRHLRSLHWSPQSSESVQHVLTPDPRLSGGYMDGPAHIDKHDHTRFGYRDIYIGPDQPGNA